MAHAHDGAAGPRPDGRGTAAHPTTHSAAVLTPPTGMAAVAPPAAPRIPQQRTPAEPAERPEPTDPAPPSGSRVRTCTCGHPEEMHEHYRPGSDCGACGPRACGTFRPADARPSRNPLRALLRRRR